MNESPVKGHEARTAAGDATEKYLTFALAEETYGVGILAVQEIIGIMPVTKVPNMPKQVRGVVNLRGRVIPVVDLRLKFGLDEREDTDRTCIVVLQVHAGQDVITLGIIVDEVCEVVDMKNANIEPAPSFGSQVNTEFIEGMGKIADKVVILLDMDKVLTAGEMAIVTEVSSGEP